ncbi:MAG: cytosolic protein [Desulfobacteraceae bacterium]|nr:cytosolic protein [Desulfobacteraceae bacterium]MBC2757122.1 cytosolic protein [Desulfobacteraceae bacterium]
MSDRPETPNDLNNKELAQYIVNLFQRIVIHYSLWFTEVKHQMGMEKALAVLDEATARGLKIQMSRLSKTLGFEMKNGLPAVLTNLSRESLLELMDSVSANWLVNDGVWFQAVEFAHGMNDAKRCNDSAWAQFSPFEAWSIKKFLNMPTHPGLEGLKKALGFRVYANINVQSIVDEGPDSFVFQMNDCRVQSARKRKGLDDYPCKSGGMVEYTYFARSIDDCISTECIGCPPDKHPEEWYCAWRFKINS